MTLWAVVCSVCGALGPVVPSRDALAAVNRAHGYELVSVRGIEGWWCPTCRAVRAACSPPATRAECENGPRPCTRFFCKYHLAADVSRKAKKDFVLPETCALDVVDNHDEGMTLREIGALLGMTREGTRYLEVNVKERVRELGLEIDLPEHHEHWTDRRPGCDSEGFADLSRALDKAIKKHGLEYRRKR